MLIGLLTDGLTHIFAIIKVTEDIRQLPSNFQAVIEWARISYVYLQATSIYPSLSPTDRQHPCPRLASTVFQHFVAADNASETFAGLKRIHGLMPYFMLKGVLKVSNPVSMIRGA